MTDTFTYPLRVEHIPPGNSRDDLRGAIPESWLCVDCGVNTAPGLSTRVEMEAALAAGKDGIEQRMTSDSEVYVVRDRVWTEAGMGEFGGCLCIGCLERRIGRSLRPKDFQRNHALNLMPGTSRLLKRQGRRGGKRVASRHRGRAMSDRSQADRATYKATRAEIERVAEIANKIECVVQEYDTGDALNAMVAVLANFAASLDPQTRKIFANQFDAGLRSNMKIFAHDDEGVTSFTGPPAPNRQCFYTTS
jgi:hypothetical protein